MIFFLTIRRERFRRESPDRVRAPLETVFRERDDGFACHYCRFFLLFQRPGDPSVGRSGLPWHFFLRFFMVNARRIPVPVTDDDGPDRGRRAPVPGFDAGR